MARLEGIRSPFPAQPSARSAKLRFYESLFLWNQGVDQLIATLRSMERFPFARMSALQYAQAEIEEVSSEVNADFMEELADRELDDGGRFSKLRRDYEKKREDPDDVYIDLQRPRGRTQKAGIAATYRHRSLFRSSCRRRTHGSGTKTKEGSPQKALETRSECQKSPVALDL